MIIGYFCHLFLINTQLINTQKFPQSYNPNHLKIIRIVSRNTQKMQNMSKMDMSKMGAMSMGMSTVISWNTHCVVFLIPGLHARNAMQFFCGCFVVLVIAALSQLLGLTSFRESWFGERRKKVEKTTSSIVFEVGNGIDSDRATKNQDKISQTPEKQNIRDRQVGRMIKIALYYAFIAVLSLLLMLIAMTMNGYIILSVALGTGIGKAIVTIRNEQNAKKIEQKQSEQEKIQQYFCQM